MNDLLTYEAVKPDSLVIIHASGQVIIHASGDNETDPMTTFLAQCWNRFWGRSCICIVINSDRFLMIWPKEVSLFLEFTEEI